MKSFKVKDKLINQIIYFFKNYYNLNSKKIESLLIKDEKNNIKGYQSNYFSISNDKDEDNNFIINIPYEVSYNTIPKNNV